MATIGNESTPASSSPATNDTARSIEDRIQHVILFYKYHPLSPDTQVTEIYRSALERLCRSLALSGRILVGCSRTEGINGTLAGEYKNVRAFTYALLGKRDDSDSDVDISSKEKALDRFWSESRSFFESIGEPELKMDSPEDFKWSKTTESGPLFPDLNIKLVNELIGTGGVLSSVSLDETAKGYLKPKEWREELAGLDESSKDTVIIDCRNTKEYEIGHFMNALDPKTTTFSQFPKWVEDHSHILADKKVLMYCTGGIRCEKASAYIRRQIPSVKDVKHLKGGIHKYLEEFGSDDGGMWKGRNFVFDGRQAASAEETRMGKDGSLQSVAPRGPADSGEVVGRCLNCGQPYDNFVPHCVCTVCREPTLICTECQTQLIEYHCRNHFHLRSCYFSELTRFSVDELGNQLDGLQSALADIAVGRRFRQKRKTLQKQCQRVSQQLHELEIKSDAASSLSKSPKQCRNCGDVDCSGRCWGFYGLKRKEVLERRSRVGDDSVPNQARSEAASAKLACQQLSKKLRRETTSGELDLALPPSSYRDNRTGIRVPPCTTRILQCSVRAKWCGRSVLDVVQNQFNELAQPKVLEQVLAHRLLKVNDRVVTALEAADFQLKSSDTISRILHWHEAPVIVPNEIAVQRISLPTSVLEEYGIASDDGIIYVCNKPSSVPVHPAGPFLSNTLTMMVEAQENLKRLSLRPIHRTDRVTSGLTLCCTDATVSKVLHKSITQGVTQKLYLARVHGKFPSSAQDASLLPGDEVGRFSWCDETKSLTVDAPVETTDPSNGIRAITREGKPSRSVFRLLSYKAEDDMSLVSCCPVTGRNHQLRVHLQWLGFPIRNDIQYGSINSDQIDLGEQAIYLMEESMNSTNCERQLAAISDEEVAAAKQACPCCFGGRHGICSSFTPAQLLHRGHSIDLHALWYRVTFLPKKAGGHGDPQDTLGAIDFRVDPPYWADSSLVTKLL